MFELKEYLSHLKHQSKPFRRRLNHLPILFQIRLQRIVQVLGLPDYTLFVLSAVFTGAIAGFAAVAFHDTIEFFNHLFFDRSKEVIGFLGSLGIILLPAAGMLLQSAMIALWPHLAWRRGVLEVIKAVAVRGGYIPFRVTLFHLIAPAICMGSGGTVGPEGPAAQIGAGVASRFGHTLGLSDERRRIFTAAGSGAAISAIFNTPLGGVFFALEIALLNDFQANTFSALLLASVTASVISRVMLGNEPTFAVGEVAIGSYSFIFWYALLGICAGVLAVFFLRYTDWLHVRMPKLMQRFPRAAIMAIAGLAVGVAGYFFRDIFGIGYAGINHVLEATTVWQLALVLLLLKFLLVPLVLESGGHGGVFAPSLFLGAMLGLLLSTAINLLTPITGFTAQVNTFALVGMGSVLAAVNSIPLAAIMIIFEMTNNYNFILPLMLGVVSSTIVTHIVVKDNIYSRKLRRAGYRLSSGRDATILQRVKVREVMQRDDVVIIPEKLPLSEMLNVCINSPHEDFYIHNDRGELTGTITTSTLRQMITDYENLKTAPLIAKDVADAGVITVTEDDDLDQVLRMFGQGHQDEFPVVSRQDPRKIAGSVRRQDVIRAYNKESLKYDASEGVARNLRMLKKTRHVEIGKGYALAEVVAPRAFVGKTLGELKLRSEHDVEVVMIRLKEAPFDSEDAEVIRMPSVDYRIHEGDTLVLFGNQKRLKKIERL